MYDFYNNPPKTREQLREWLTSWLEPIDGEFYYNGNPYKQERGFRRAFYDHIVLVDKKTGKYGFWCYEPPNGFATFPTEWFSTYEEMIEDQVEKYYTLWKLTH